MKNSKKIVLICKNVKFNSQNDEFAFVEWLKEIDCINSILEENKKLCLYIKSKRLSNVNLDDLIGLFYRYKINMKQLAQFLNNKNKYWFYDNKKAFWHRRVFGKQYLLN